MSHLRNLYIFCISVCFFFSSTSSFILFRSFLPPFSYTSTPPLPTPLSYLLFSSAVLLLLYFLRSSSSFFSFLFLFNCHLSEFEVAPVTFKDNHIATWHKLLYNTSKPYRTRRTLEAAAVRVVL